MICTRRHQPQTDLFATRFNNKLPNLCHQFQTPLAWAVDTLSLPWKDLDPYAFPPVAILGTVVVKLRDYPCRRIILIAPGWPNMPWFCSGHVKRNPFVTAQHTNSAFQSDPSQEPVKPKYTYACLASNASAIRGQSFSEPIAAQIEVPQRLSTRSVYEAKWTIFTK